MISIKELLDEENVTSGGEKIGGYRAFEPEDEEQYDDLNERQSISTIYKNQSPNQKMNYSVLRAVRHLKEAKCILSECCDLKASENIRNSHMMWDISKQKTREAGDLLRECNQKLRELEA